MRLSKIRICVAVVFISAPLLFPGASQKSNLHVNIEFQHLSYKDGLNSAPFSMCEDHLGYIWFGCSHGACRYDGYEFKLFECRPNTALVRTKRNRGICEDQQGNIWLAERSKSGVFKLDRRTGLFTHYAHHPDDSTTLSTNHADGFFLDSHGFLWIASIEEDSASYISYLDRMDTRSGKVKRCRHDSGDPATPSADRVFSFSIGFADKLVIAEDRESAVWIGMLNAGINRYNRDSETFTRFQHNLGNPKSLSSDQVRSITTDSKGSIWISTANGINHFRAETGAFDRYAHDPNNPNSLASDDCHYVYQDKGHKFWISHAHGLDRFDPETGVFEHFRHNPGDASSLSSANRYLPVYEDEFDRLWILFKGDVCGLNIYDPQLDIFRRCENDHNDPMGFHAINFYFCEVDRSGTMWIGSSDQIINRIDPNTNRFLNLTKNEALDSTLLSNSIRLLLASRKDSVIWLTSSEGLTKYHWKTGRFDYFKHNPHNPNSLCDNNVNGFVEDDAGNLWISTNNGLDEMDTQGNFTHYKHIPGDSTTLSENRVYRLIHDPAGYLWICTTFTGLNRLDLRTGQVKQFIKDDKNPTSLNAEKQVFYIFKDKAGVLWIGCDLGLSRYNYESEDFISVLEGFVVFQIYEDRWGGFWIGTLFDGIVNIDRETGEWRRFEDGHPLARCAITDIVEDNDGLMWIGTNRGLVKFNPLDNSTIAIREEHGLPETRYLTEGALRQDGQIVWGSWSKGFIQFDPKEIRLNEKPPQVVIPDIKISNESLPVNQDSPLRQDISLTTELHLRHDQNDISFVCAALHYVRPEKNQYAFWLENWDEKWYQAGTTRIATYTNLDPGRYIFRVKTANSDGVWNEQGRSLAIVIHPPWYARTWSYGIYFLIITGIIYALWSTQLRRIRLRDALQLQQIEAKKLLEIDQMKTQFLANISHEFRTPLTLILGPIEALLKRLNKNEDISELAVMRRNAQRLSRLVNQLLDLSKIEAGKMTLQVQHDDLVKFTNRIVQSFESRAKLKHIALAFTAETTPIFLHFDHEKMEHVFYNLLSNAIKFTPENGSVNVTIRTTLKDDEKIDFPAGMVEISVQDDGIGIQPEQLEKIFDRFYQGESAAKIKDAGTGIGLALAKQLVELHHGSLHLSSTVGSGSTFTVRLPLGVSHLKEEEIVDATPPVEYVHENVTEYEKQKVSSPLKAPAILIVEDNSDLRYYMRTMLADAYKIDEAENGLSGFDSATDKIPDLIITDVMMPEMDGFELCNKLKKDERTSHIPIIMLTARADLDSRIHGLETGADDYLVKPFNEMELKVRVKNLIEQRQKLRLRFSRDILTPINDIAITSADERFLQRAIEIISGNMIDASFGPEPLALKIGLSRSQLHRKLKATVNMSTTTFIRSIRLRRAADLLTKKFGTIGQIAYEVGFNNPAYFSDSFRKQFGCLPSEYKNQV